MNNDEKLVFGNLYKLQKWDAELPNCAYRSLKKYSPGDIDKLIFFLLYAEILMLCCGDNELNPGPEMCYEYFFNVYGKYKNNLRFVHLNFLGKVGISESWLTPNDKMFHGM